MKKSNIILLVIAVVIVIICFSGFSTYNGLVDKQETATTALADVPGNLSATCGPHS